MNLIMLLLVLPVKCSFGMPPGPTLGENQEDINTLKYATKMLAAQLEKWNNLFLTSLEPRMSSTAASLASIDSNVNNLQERAHIWDTFQLHVAAWNEQLASLDRKVDIISKGQEKMLALESKIDSVVNMGYKIDDVLAKVEKFQESLSDLKKDVETKNHQENDDVLFGEFATRGILSTLKVIEKKLDRFQQSQQNLIIMKNGEEKRKLTIKCNTRFVEEILNDMSSKVDIIFDRVNSSGDNEEEYDFEDYRDGSGNNEMPLEIKIAKKAVFLKKTSANADLQELSMTILKIENISHIVLDKEDDILRKIDNVFNANSTFMTFALNKIKENSIQFNENFDKIMNSYFNEQRAHFESSLQKHFTKRKFFDSANVPEPFPTETVQKSPFLEPAKQGCEDLDKNQMSSVYIFSNITDFNSNNRSYNKKYCIIRDDGAWTVLQRRDNFSPLQNFNMSWFEYKHGFGSLTKDFWFGNDFISRFSQENDLLLRIELEDFDGNSAWAEYSTFKVFSEADLYRLIVGKYKGNASDSLSSHNNTFFSTFDLKNDEAPDCCPCAVSFGGGWWFNSCFESNLNGIYYKEPRNNGYFGGIIWEHWLGDYSLKQTLMMAKPIRRLAKKKSTWSYVEDP